MRPQYNVIIVDYLASRLWLCELLVGNFFIIFFLFCAELCIKYNNRGKIVEIIFVIMEDFF